jgi:hypothetical protein
MTPITGLTGTIGQQTVEQLIAADQPLRRGRPDPDRGDRRASAARLWPAAGAAATEPKTSNSAAQAFPPLPAQGAAMAIEDAVRTGRIARQQRRCRRRAALLRSKRLPRVETIRAAVSRRTIARGMERPVTPELLE